MPDPRLNFEVNFDDKKAKGQIDSFGSFLKSKFVITAGDVKNAIVTMGSALKSFATEAMEVDTVAKALESSMKRAGTYSEEASKAFSEFASTMQKTTKYTDEQIIKAGALGTSLTGLSQDKLQGAIKAATDLSTAMGVDLDTAMLAVSKSVNGNSAYMQRMGIQLEVGKDKAKNLQIVMDGLNSRFGGRAQADAETYAGKIAIITNVLNDQKEKIGQVVLQKIFDNLDTKGAVEQIDKVGTALAKLTGKTIEVGIETAKQPQQLATSWIALSNGLKLVSTVMAILITSLLVASTRIGSLNGIVATFIRSVAAGLAALRAGLTGAESQFTKAIGLASPKIFKFAESIRSVVTSIPGLSSIIGVFNKLATPIAVLDAGYRIFKAIFDLFNTGIKKGFVSGLKDAAAEIIRLIDDFVTGPASLLSKAFGHIPKLLGGNEWKLFTETIGGWSDAVKKYAKSLEDSTDSTNKNTKAKEGNNNAGKEGNNILSKNLVTAQQLFEARLAYDKAVEKGNTEEIIAAKKKVDLLEEQAKDLDNVKIKADALMTVHKREAEEQRKTSEEIEKDLNKRDEDRKKAYKAELDDAVKLNEEKSELRKKSVEEGIQASVELQEKTLKIQEEAIDKARAKGSWLARLFGMDDKGKLKTLLDTAFTDITDNLFKKMTNPLGGFLTGFGSTLVEMAISSLFGGNKKYGSIVEYSESAFAKMISKTEDALAKLTGTYSITKGQIGALQEYKKAGLTYITPNLGEQLGISYDLIEQTGGDIGKLTAILSQTGYETATKRIETLKGKVTTAESNVGSLKRIRNVLVANGLTKDGDVYSFATKLKNKKLLSATDLTTLEQNGLNVNAKLKDLDNAIAGAEGSLTTAQQTFGAEMPSLTSEIIGYQNAIVAAAEPIMVAPVASKIDTAENKLAYVKSLYSKFGPDYKLTEEDYRLLGMTRPTDPTQDNITAVINKFAGQATSELPTTLTPIEQKTSSSGFYELPSYSAPTTQTQADTGTQAQTYVFNIQGNVVDWNNFMDQMDTESLKRGKRGVSI